MGDFTPLCYDASIPASNMEIDPSSAQSAESTAWTAPEAPAASAPAAAEGGASMRLRARRIVEVVRGKSTLLWWIHSGYALLFGLGVMWLGARDFDYLRLVIFHISFIWVTSLFLPALVNRPWLSDTWRKRMRLAINYFNKSFYQQLLFFLLPIYWASTTFGSRNTVFFLLLAASAVLSTMDIVYDRYLSARWHSAALFFMFNLFAAINVMLPVLWSVSNHAAIRLSGVLALAGFASMLYRLSGWRGRAAKVLLGAAAGVMLLIVELLPPLIPPAPLRLASARFGRSVESLQVVAPLSAIPTAPGRVAALTAIKAPMGLVEQVRHRWRLDGRVIFVSPFHSLTGGRTDGYRFWTRITLKETAGTHRLTVDVETRGGQLIGRARLGT
jgi:hypothetical protein